MRTRTFLLYLLLVVSMSAFSAEPSFKIGGFYYKIDDLEKRTCIVWGPGEAEYMGDGKVKYPSSDIRIPSIITYKGVSFTVVGIQGYDHSDRESPFRNNPNITSLYVPKTVEWIGRQAFSGCVNLQKVVIEDGVKYIGHHAFSWCKNLKSIKLPNTLKRIGHSCFQGCEVLTGTIQIPPTCEWIGGQAFSGCYNPNLSVVIQDGENPLEMNFKEIFMNVRGKYIYIGRTMVDVFYDIHGVYGNRNDPQHYGYYSYPYNFKKVVYGNNVKNMSDLSFPFSQKLEFRDQLFQELTIGSSIKEVPDFSDSYVSIKAIYVMNNTPPSAKGFSDKTYLDGVLYVPIGAKETYKKAAVWKNFMTIKEFDTPKTASLNQKAEGVRPQVSTEEERLREEQQRLQRQQQAERERIQKEAELKKKREERLARIMNMIPKDGTKQWIYDKRKLVHEYYMDKNSEGAYVDGDNFVCELLLTNDNVYSIELFVRNSMRMLKILLSYEEIWGSLNGKYEGTRYVIETLPESVSDEKLAESINRTINKMKQARRALQLKTPVDLGLSVKWAPCNVGALHPWDYGDYFAWGETVGYGKSDPSNAHNYAYGNTYVKTHYYWDTYKYCSGISGSTMTKYESTMTKYNTKKKYGKVVDNKTTLDLADDAARANMGGSWRMPTSIELRELIDNCYWEWTDSYRDSGVRGYIVYKVKNIADRGKWKNSGVTETTVGTYSLSDSHIFLPAAGYRGLSDLKKAGDTGDYWSSSLNEDSSYAAYSLHLSSDAMSLYSYGRRYAGQSVRAVVE